MVRSLAVLSVVVVLTTAPFATVNQGGLPRIRGNVLQAQVCGACTNILVNHHAFFTGANAFCDGGDPGGDRTCHQNTLTGICGIVHGLCGAAAKRHFKELSGILATQRPEKIRAYLSSDTKYLAFNARRGSIQLKSCDGQTIANIALSPVIVAALVRNDGTLVRAIGGHGSTELAAVK